MGCFFSNGHIKNKENELINSFTNLRIRTKKDIIKKSLIQNKKRKKNIDDNFKIPIAVSKTRIEECYIIDKKTIGEGHFGSIKLGYFKDNNYRKFAIKSILRNDLKNNYKLILNELNIMRNLDHPNIIKFFETYYDNKNFHFVMEYCEGGDLDDYLMKKKIILEDEAKEIVFQILYAINHLHQKNVAHRDIKLDNFLFLNKDQKQIKLTDFGLSRNFTDSKMNSLLGTPYYVAPEVLNGSYTCACDNWSVGVIIYYLLSGEPPFIGKYQKQVFQAISKGKFSFSNDIWKNISNEAKDLIKKLLIINPDRRITAVDALDHPWFKKVNYNKLQFSSKFINNDLINRFMNYQNNSIFKGEVLKLVIDLFNNDNKIKDLMNSYFYLDYNNSGLIHKLEIETFFKEQNIEISNNRINEIIENLYLKDDNAVTYTEYIIATLDLKEFLDKNKLEIVFRRFDVDNSGYITLENLQECFKRFGFRLNNEYLKQMIKEFDIDENNVISFNEFSEIMLKNN